jgi:hypothetical protein
MKPKQTAFMLHCTRTPEMTATNMINIFDRFALTLMNTLVLVGLPLVAVGLVAQSF